jgi:hypothetical protein
MLRDGLVGFEGNAAELRASTDEYIRNFFHSDNREELCHAHAHWPGPELKIGAISIFAIVMTLVLVFLLSGEGGFPGSSTD